jgi:hypothetical protein
LLAATHSLDLAVDDAHGGLREGRGDGGQQAGPVARLHEEDGRVRVVCERHFRRRLWPGRHGPGVAPENAVGQALALDERLERAGDRNQILAPYRGAVFTLPP